MHFVQLLTAMVTPFDQEGKIDFDQTSILIEHLIKTGTEGLVVAGTTGESPTLSVEEKIQLFKHVVDIVNNRIPVIAGTGSNDTKDSIKLTKAAENCGVDGIMLVVPYYNKPNQLGMYKHFEAIAKETKLPIMLYNIPGRSGVNMTADTIIQLSKIDNIVSVKEASGDLDQVSKIIEQTDREFNLYSGDDGLTLPMLSVGAAGIVSVASHIIGNDIKRMIRAYNTGNNGEAAQIHRTLLPVMKGLFAAPSPAPVKSALRLSGIDCGSVRLPLVDLTKEEEMTLKNILKQ